LEQTMTEEEIQDNPIQWLTTNWRWAGL